MTVEDADPERIRIQIDRSLHPDPIKKMNNGVWIRSHKKSLGLLPDPNQDKKSLEFSPKVLRLYFIN